jgi:hypothetical protein
MSRSIVVLALLAAAATAQAETRVGVVGGLSLARMHMSPEDPTGSFETFTGFAGGAVLDVDLSRHLSLSLEPMYVRKGSDFRIESDGFLFDEGLTGSLRVDYLELPALLKVRFGDGSVRPYLIGGPTAAYRLSSKSSAMGETVDSKKLFKEWDFGVSAGAGLAFPLGMASGFLEARYGLGLVNVAEETAENESVKNRGVLILAGITLGVGGR